MLFEIEPQLVYYAMLFLTMLTMPFMFYCYCIVSRVLQYKATEATISQCASVFKENEDTVRDAAGAVFNLVDRVEEHCYQYYRGTAMGIAVSGILEKTFMPIVDLCKKYFTRARQQSSYGSGTCPLPSGTCPLPSGTCPLPSGTCPLPRGTCLARSCPIMQRCPMMQDFNTPSYFGKYDSSYRGGYGDVCCGPVNPYAQPNSFEFCRTYPDGSCAMPLYPNNDYPSGLFANTNNHPETPDFTLDGSGIKSQPCSYTSKAVNVSAPSTPDFTVDGTVPKNQSFYPVSNPNVSKKRLFSGFRRSPLRSRVGKYSRTSNTRNVARPSTSNMGVYPGSQSSSINDYSKYIDLFMNVFNDTLASNTRDKNQRCTDGVNCETDGFCVTRCSDGVGAPTPSNSNECRIMLDMARTFDDPSTVSSYDFSKMTKPDAMVALVRMSGELNLGVQESNGSCVQMFDTSKYTVPNQKVADFLRLLSFVSLGEDEFRKMNNECSSQNVCGTTVSDSNFCNNVENLCPSQRENCGPEQCGSEQCGSEQCGSSECVDAKDNLDNNDVVYVTDKNINACETGNTHSESESQSDSDNEFNESTEENEQN
ncbi:hypothetical protein QJ857_gp0607 [Tupanvirus soda lake]|uniref:Uncharacterized protein n=2 Tax=Tupanvirus TaxID=2094720 RepID=A0A6N1NVF5_9VIRU|nr:hypothetical protein QJ857_gp0607 [Tupanvirus soda lake]QKU35436.1 hypothetical protein [Tupanvirus soda lake]